MLDVHPPHAPTHTWRDFFIHIATICVGLLIAVALEQTVEAIHHHHQRKELEHNLRNEISKGLVLLDDDNRRFATYIPRLEEEVREVAAMRKNPGAPPPQTKDPYTDWPDWTPDASAWLTAKASGQIALLPNEEAAVFNIVYANEEQLLKDSDPLLTAVAAQYNFERQFCDDPASAAGRPDLTRMTPAELGQYETLLTTTLDAARFFKQSVALTYDLASAVRDGARTDEELYRKAGIDTRTPAISPKPSH